MQRCFVIIIASLDISSEIDQQMACIGAASGCVMKRCLVVGVASIDIGLLVDQKHVDVRPLMAA